MALNFFTQRDIDNMDINEIPEEFMNYFDGLPEERKKAILASRPDLEEVLTHSDIVTEVIEAESKIEEKDGAFIKENIEESASTDNFDIPNVYESIDIEAVARGNLGPFEALTIRDGQDKCLIHRKKFERVQISYFIGRKTYGVMPYFCRECNRLFLEESKSNYQEALREKGIEAKIYPLEISDRYIRKQLPEIELKDGEEVFFPDVWIEEKPTCPIHDTALDGYPYVIKAKGKEIKFTGYFCDKCNKTILRRSKALDLEDECARKGIPMPKITPLIDKKPRKEKASVKLIKPHYLVDNGKKEEFTYQNSSDFYRLTEEDTVVVSDSSYCNLMDHDTEEVEIVFWVNQKRDGRKLFLCAAGYCAQCQKYYLAEEDYRVIYSLGRPEVTVISDLEEDDYQITSGEVFDIEKRHLDDLEGEFTDRLDLIHNATDYVNPYAVISGGYDDGGLSSSKAASQRKYGPIIEKIAKYQPKPYSYRVDIVFDGKSETFYVGADDIDMDGDRRVISYNSDFGKQLVNYRTINIVKDGKQYDIKLSRQFDIEQAQLYGYVNLRTDEDIIFRAGITDPFLVKVLNLRKKQHNLVDIIATIQENQNSIVDIGFNQNIIVQGCAGSGKTMVLLHRLSSLKYKHPEFDFAKALILTPNEQFNLHIKGLAEGLQIGNIDRISIEQYYIGILKNYSAELVPNNKISSEIFVNQQYVDYIYSDEFLEKFNSVYVRVISGRNHLLGMLQVLTGALGEEYKEPIVSSDSEMIPKIKSRVDHFSSLVTTRENHIKEAKEALWFVQKRKEELEEKIPKAEEFANNIVKETLPRVYAKIGTYISDAQATIDAQQNIINQVTQEAMKVENQFMLFGKKAKLDELKKETDKAERKKKSEQAKLDDAKLVFDFPVEGKTDEEVIAWMKQLILYIDTVREDIRLCERGKNELSGYIEERASIDDKIIAAQKKLDEELATKYPDDVSRSIAYLQTKIIEYSDLNTWNQIFESATAEFKTLNKIKVNKGTHRYDLYARIWFCMKFYGKCTGMSNFICVDEGQDVSFNEYKLIYELNHKEVIYNIFGDTNQCLKPGRGIVSWDRLIDEFNAALYQLNENYRNTNQITRFCNASFEMDVLQTGVDGAKVREIPRRDLEKELSALLINNERIAILIPRSVQRKKYIVKDVLPDHIKNVLGDKIDNGLIAVMYVDEVKGIEFDKVFVIANKMTKNEKYIAYTRALSELIIVVDDQIIEHIPTEEDETVDQSLV